MSVKLIIKKASAIAAALTAFVALSAPAHAVLFSFADLDGAGTGVSVASQMTVDVTETGGGSTIDFVVANTGILSAIITQINFDDSANNVLGSFVSFAPSAGVIFVQDLKNLPQGNSVGFTSTDGFTRQNAGGVSNGINPGESLGIRFNLNGTFAAAIAALTSGSLNIGMHVQSLPDGSSDTLITNIPEVPLPAALPLLLTGLAGMSLFGRRKNA